MTNNLSFQSMENLLLQTHLNHTIIALNPTSTFLSLSLLPYAGLFGTWLALTVHHILLNITVFQSFHLLKRRTSTVTLRNVLNKHSPTSLRKVINHKSSPWFESIRDELFIAKREKHQAVCKWRNTKLTTFKDLYRHAKHKVTNLVHTAKCPFNTERIALTSSSNEMQ